MFIRSYQYRYCKINRKIDSCSWELIMWFKDLRNLRNLLNLGAYHSPSQLFLRIDCSLILPFQSIECPQILHYFKNMLNSVFIEFLFCAQANAKGHLGMFHVKIKKTQLCSLSECRMKLVSPTLWHLSEENL